MAIDGPIAVIDSGLGGLTVVRELRRTLPHEDIVYFGDTARLPYGSKSAETVSIFVKQIIGYLRRFEPKHVVIACNTATALAMPAIRQQFPTLSVSGVIDPGAKAAAEAAGPKESPVIAVIATEATIRSKAYEKALHRRRSMARLLLRPTPLLVPIIEEGRRNDDALVILALKQYLKPIVERKPDVLVLGCTHYPILKKAIAEIVGPATRVIDSAEQCAEDVARRLASTSALRQSHESGATLRCFVTDDSPRFATIATRFLGWDIGKPTWIAPDQLTRIEFSSTPIRVAS